MGACEFCNKGSSYLCWCYPYILNTFSIHYKFHFFYVENENKIGKTELKVWSNNSNFTEKDDISEIIYEIQQIEKELQSRYLVNIHIQRYVLYVVYWVHGPISHHYQDMIFLIETNYIPYFVHPQRLILQAIKKTKNQLMNIQR